MSHIFLKCDGVYTCCTLTDAQTNENAFAHARRLLQPPVPVRGVNQLRGLQMEALEAEVMRALVAGVGVGVGVRGVVQATRFSTTCSRPRRSTGTQTRPFSRSPADKTHMAHTHTETRQAHRCVFMCVFARADSLSHAHTHAQI